MSLNGVTNPKCEGVNGRMFDWPKIQLKFLWYDMWIGAFYDRIRRVLYICPLPMVVIKIVLPERHYVIVGGYSGLDIGCCTESGKDDVLEEEPRSSFRPVRERNCPICSRDE